MFIYVIDCNSTNKIHILKHLKILKREVQNVNAKSYYYYYYYFIANKQISNAKIHLRVQRYVPESPVVVYITTNECMLDITVANYSVVVGM